MNMLLLPQSSKAHAEMESSRRRVAISHDYLTDLADIAFKVSYIHLCTIRNAVGNMLTFSVCLWYSKEQPAPAHVSHSSCSQIVRPIDL
jgi:hypothetical protein